MAQNYSTLTTMIIVPPFCSFNCTHSRSSLIDQSLHLKITNIYPSSPSVILEQIRFCPPKIELILAPTYFTKK